MSFKQFALFYEFLGFINDTWHTEHFLDVCERYNRRLVLECKLLRITKVQNPRQCSCKDKINKQFTARMQGVGDQHPWRSLPTTAPRHCSRQWSSNKLARPYHGHTATVEHVSCACTRKRIARTTYLYLSLHGAELVRWRTEVWREKIYHRLLFNERFLADLIITR